MVPEWIRRSFSAAGLTQIPPGPHLGALQGRFGGTVMLCIDVSGSMHGPPLHAAIQGATEFVTEAIAAHYQVGVLLWNTDVVALATPSADGAAASRLLASGSQAYGGTSLLAPLQRCHQILDGHSGDRVVAIFGDGDLGSRDRVLAKVAEMKAEDIRFVTRGLGARAAAEFAPLSTADPADVQIGDVGDLAAGIASMAAALGPRRQPPAGGC